jgi:hypothetical protein
MPKKILLLTLLAFAMAGCVREGDEDTNEGADTRPDELAVEVLITDASIELPAEISGGPVLFEVTNNGTTEHGFVIDGVDEGIESLGIDELDTLRTELEPGTYTVYSPVEGDRENGLEVQLTVTEEAAESAPLEGQGVGPSEEQEPIEDDGG